MAVSSGVSAVQAARAQAWHVGSSGRSNGLASTVFGSTMFAELVNVLPKNVSIFRIKAAGTSQNRK